MAALLHGDPTPCFPLTSLRGADVVVTVTRAHSVIHLTRSGVSAPVGEHKHEAGGGGGSCGYCGRCEVQTKDTARGPVFHVFLRNVPVTKQTFTRKVFKHTAPRHPHLALFTSHRFPCDVMICSKQWAQRTRRPPETCGGGGRRG